MSDQIIEPESEKPEAEAVVAQPIEEAAPYFIWLLGFLVSALVAGAFFLTGLFLSTFMGWKGELAGGILTGLIPGAVSGGVMTGLVYSVYPKWTGKALGFSLFFIALPLVLVPFGFGLISGFSMALAPIATVLAGLGSPWIIRMYRKRGMGKLKTPKGSWEDNF